MTITLHSFYKPTQEKPHMMQLTSLLPISLKASVDTTSHVNNTKPSVNFKSSLSLWLQITPWKYPATLKDPITKFRRCNPIKLPKHPWDEYGTITSQYLTNNYNRMTAQWNITTPIEDLFLQLCDGQEFATDIQETIYDSQLLWLCYYTTRNTGLFNDALKVWRDKAQTDKTYVLLCTYMTVEHRDKTKNQLTSEGAG